MKPELVEQFEEEGVYSSYYDNQEYMEEIGVDSDLLYAMHYHISNFNPTDIKKVHAVVEGSNDGPDWHWIIELEDGRFVYMHGGCDYTGWDCQSSAEAVIADNLKAAMSLIPDESIYLQLGSQLLGEKKLTWRETMNSLLFGDSAPDIITKPITRETLKEIGLR